MSIWTSSSPQPRIARAVVVRLAGERDDDALDVELADELGSRSARRAPEVLEIGATGLRVRVDEPDEVHAVLGMVDELARDQLPTSPAPTMTRSGVAGCGGDGSRERAGDDDEPIAITQKEKSFGRSGLAGCAASGSRRRTTTPVPMKWKTPTRSSTVVWSARCPSRS